MVVDSQVSCPGRRWRVTIGRGEEAGVAAGMSVLVSAWCCSSVTGNSLAWQAGAVEGRRTSTGGPRHHQGVLDLIGLNRVEGAHCNKGWLRLEAELVQSLGGVGWPQTAGVVGGTLAA